MIPWETLKVEPINTNGRKGIDTIKLNPASQIHQAFYFNIDCLEPSPNNNKNAQTNHKSTGQIENQPNEQGWTSCYRTAKKYEDQYIPVKVRPIIRAVNFAKKWQPAWYKRRIQAYQMKGKPEDTN